MVTTRGRSFLFSEEIENFIANATFLVLFAYFTHMLYTDILKTHCFIKKSGVGELFHARN